MWPISIRYAHCNPRFSTSRARAFRAAFNFPCSWPCFKIEENVVVFFFPKKYPKQVEVTITISKKNNFGSHIRTISHIRCLKISFVSLFA